MKFLETKSYDWKNLKYKHNRPIDLNPINIVYKYRGTKLYCIIAMYKLLENIQWYSI